MKKLLYIAAHGGFASERVALGGGAAIADLLAAEWRRTRPFALEMVTPRILGEGAPRGADLVRYSEREYARFCFDFRRAATGRALREDPDRTIILVNDVSEAPDLAVLARSGFRIHTIYHVDVVAYIAGIYLRGLVRPETLARWWERGRAAAARWAPGILRLIFENQRDSVLHSRSIIVPSREMKAVLDRAYGAMAAGKVRVHPWGAPPHEATWEEADRGAQDLRREYGVPPEAMVLLTLSRLSPEKGQDRLLRALASWERQPDFPAQPIWLFVCGGAAYMQGQRHLRQLREAAARLRRVRVVFPGHVTGSRKAAFFRLATVYVFPSRHESYGLTLAEALSWGCRVVALDTAGAREVAGDAVVSEEQLAGALARALALGPARVPEDLPQFEAQAAALADHLLDGG